MSGWGMSDLESQGEKSDKHIDEILESIDWEKAWTDIPPNDRQDRIEDDSDDGKLAVVFSNDGDAWIATYPSKHALGQSGLRFRVPGCGGGQSSRVRKALMVLAMAIKADNEQGT